MNERIKELQKQCWNHQTWQLDVEKFVELIVRECCTKMALEIMDHYVDDALKNTYEHFGVEE